MEYVLLCSQTVEASITIFVWLAANLLSQASASIHANIAHKIVNIKAITSIKYMKEYLAIVHTQAVVIVTYQKGYAQMFWKFKIRKNIHVWNASVNIAKGVQQNASKTTDNGWRRANRWQFSNANQKYDIDLLITLFPKRLNKVHILIKIIIV